MTAEQIKILRDAKKFGMKIGDTIHLQIGGDEVCDKFKKIKRSALTRGEAVHSGDGIQWQDDRMDIDITKHGSDQYVWNSSGSKVRASRFLMTRKCGVVTEKFMKKVYVEL